MYVFVVIGFYPPDHSGAGLRILRTYTALAQAHDVSFEVLAEPVRVSSGEPDPANVTRLSSATFAPLLGLKILAALLSRRKKIDIVHCIGPTRLTVITAFFCRLLRIPYISECSMEHGETRKNPLERFLIKPFFTPDGAVALTPRIAALFKESGTPESRIFLRPNPVTMDENFSPADQALRDQLAGLTQTKKHLVLGRFCERKNQKAALRLLEQLPGDHALILAGPVIGDENYFAQMSSEIKQKNLAGRILLWPETVENPFFLYQAITSLWCLSTQEGLPNVVLEALWNGRPCFVNRDLALSGWVVHAGNGTDIVLTPDMSAAAKTLLQFLEAGCDPGAIAAEARQKFDPAKINDQTYKLLQAVAQGQG